MSQTPFVTDRTIDYIVPFLDAPGPSLALALQNLIHHHGQIYTSNIHFAQLHAFLRIFLRLYSMVRFLLISCAKISTLCSISVDVRMGS